jgi:hypothetical protein
MGLVCLFDFFLCFIDFTFRFLFADFLLVSSGTVAFVAVGTSNAGAAGGCAAGAFAAGVLPLASAIHLACSASIASLFF